MSGVWVSLVCDRRSRPIVRQLQESVRAQVASLEPGTRALSGYEYHWGELVGTTRAHLPHLHEIAPRLFAGLGYNGRGVAMATMRGRILAAWALGAPLSDLPFPVTPLAPSPMRRFSQFGTRVAIQCMRRRRDGPVARSHSADE